MNTLKDLYKLIQSFDIDKSKKEKLKTFLNTFKSEFQLKAREGISTLKLLEDCFDAMTDGISILDEEFTILKVNSWMEEMYPDREGIIGKKCYEVYQGKKTVCEWCPSEKSLKDGKTHTAIVPYPSEDESTGGIEVTSFPVKDENGEVIKIIEYVEDITERKRVLNQLEKSQKKYENAYNRAEFYKDLFAHDMNNILQNIRTSIELLQLWENSSIEEYKREELIRIVETQIDRGSNLISNVRKLSILAKEDITPHETDLEEILVKSVDNLPKRINKENIDIKIIPFPDETKVLGGELLVDAFKNIIYNGIIHNENKSKEIIIKVSEEDSEGNSWLKIEFLDNGIGIEDQLKEFIFNRDERRDNSKGGLGIGLSLVKKIIESYHGKIRVENRVKEDYSQGSNFIVLLKKV
ncbi:MAG: PAS domain-containing sensor histidine kinase [Promethearchaeia archaeon]